MPLRTPVPTHLRERKLSTRSRAVVLRKIFESLGKTDAQRREKYAQLRMRERRGEKLLNVLKSKTKQVYDYELNRMKEKHISSEEVLVTLLEALEIKGAKVTGAAGIPAPWQVLRRSERAAGIERLLPCEHDVVKIINRKGKTGGPAALSRQEYTYRGRTYKIISHAVREVLRALEAAGIIKITRGKKGRITECKILDPKRLKKTAEIGYVQWPEPITLPKDVEKREKHKILKEEWADYIRRLRKTTPAQK